MSEQTDKCSEMLPHRITTSLLRNIHLQLHHITASVDDVLITKTVRSYSIQKALMSGEVRALFRAKKLPFSQMTRKLTSPPGYKAGHTGYL